jgi:hypothetical protein
MTQIAEYTPPFTTVYRLLVVRRDYRSDGIATNLLTTTCKPDALSKQADYIYSLKRHGFEASRDGSGVWHAEKRSGGLWNRHCIRLLIFIQESGLSLN